MFFCLQKNEFEITTKCSPIFFSEDTNKSLSRILRVSQATTTGECVGMLVICNKLFSSWQFKCKVFTSVVLRTFSNSIIIQGEMVSPSVSWKIYCYHWLIKKYYPTWVSKFYGNVDIWFINYPLTYISCICESLLADFLVLSNKHSLFWSAKVFNNLCLLSKLEHILERW